MLLLIFQHFFPALVKKTSHGIPGTPYPALWFPPGISTGILPELLSRIPTDYFSEIYPGIQSGIFPGLGSRIPFGILPTVGTLGIPIGVLHKDCLKSFRIPSRVLSGFLQKILGNSYEIHSLFSFDFFVVISFYIGLDFLAILLWCFLLSSYF